jgi:hypothetical protein
MDEYHELIFSFLCIAWAAALAHHPSSPRLSQLAWRSFHASRIGMDLRPFSISFREGVLLVSA